MTAEAANYRSVAGSVRVQLVDTRLNHGQPALPVDDYAKRRLKTIKKLLEVGGQFARKADGGLDQVRSATPEKLTLARELTKLVPRELDPYKSGDLDMKDWTRQAVEILDAISADDWGAVEPNVEFLKIELEGFLERLLSLPPETPRERGSRRRLPD